MMETLQTTKKAKKISTLTTAVTGSGYGADGNHDITEGLALNNDLTRNDRKVFEAISRKTLGFWQEWDAIPYSQIQRATGLKPMSVYRSLKRLQELNIISVKPNLKHTKGGWITGYKINPPKDWKALTKHSQSTNTNKALTFLNESTNILDQSTHIAMLVSKDTISKDNSKDNIKESPFENTEEESSTSDLQIPNPQPQPIAHPGPMAKGKGFTFTFRDKKYDSEGQYYRIVKTDSGWMVEVKASGKRYSLDGITESVHQDTKALWILLLKKEGHKPKEEDIPNILYTQAKGEWKQSQIMIQQATDLLGQIN